MMFYNWFNHILLMSCKDDTKNDTEPASVDGAIINPSHNHTIQSYPDDLYNLTWHSTSPVSDGLYTYNITYVDIVLAESVNGSFCVGVGKFYTTIFGAIVYLVGTFIYLVDFLLQSTLIVSTSLISNNRLSRSENLVLILTWKSNNSNK